jgi:hypothetical protein
MNKSLNATIKHMKNLLVNANHVVALIVAIRPTKIFVMKDAAAAAHNPLALISLNSCFAAPKLPNTELAS